MKNCFVVGNGTSREGLYNLDKLKQYGYVIGCNGVHIEATPNTIVALDQEPAQTLWAMQRKRGFSLITRDAKTHIIKCNGIQIGRMADIAKGRCHNSGIIALWYALSFIKPDCIYLIGYDFFRPVSGQPRNEMYTNKYITGLSMYVVNGVETLARDYPTTHIERVGAISSSDVFFFANTFRRLKFSEQLPREFSAALAGKRKVG